MREERTESVLLSVVTIRGGCRMHVQKWPTQAAIVHTETTDASHETLQDLSFSCTRESVRIVLCRRGDILLSLDLCNM